MNILQAIESAIVDDPSFDEFSFLLANLADKERDLKVNLTLDALASAPVFDSLNNEEEKQAYLNSRIQVGREFLGDINSSQQKVLEAQIKPDTSTENVLKESFISDSLARLEELNIDPSDMRLLSEDEEAIVAGLLAELGLSFRCWFMHGVNPAEIFYYVMDALNDQW